MEERDQLVVRTTAKDRRTGKMRERRRTMPAGATIAEALAVLDELKAEAAGVRVAPTRVRDPDDVPTVEAYATVWGKRRLSKGRWSPNSGTAEIVGFRLDRYVMPTFGDQFIGTITFGQLEAWLDDMAERIGPRTIRATFNHLISIDREGRQDYGLPPMSYPEAPRVGGQAGELTWANYADSTGMALTRAKLADFLGAAKAMSPTGWYPICVLGFASGARISELHAAQRGDFDLSAEVGVWLCRRHMVTIRQTSEPGVKWNKRGKAILLDATSTVLLRPFLSGGEPDALAFPSDQSGHAFRSTKGMQLFIDRVCVRAGLARVTTKVFRQTYVTLAHLRGVADAMAQAQAGHSSGRTTMTYVKPTIEHRREHAKTMADVLHSDREDD